MSSLDWSNIVLGVLVSVFMLSVCEMKDKLLSYVTPSVGYGCVVECFCGLLVVFVCLVCK